MRELPVSLVCAAWPSVHATWLTSEVSGSSPHRFPISGLAWSLYKCAALWRAVYGPSTTERPLRTTREDKGISSRLRVSISSLYWKLLKSYVKPHSFLPFPSEFGLGGDFRRILRFHPSTYTYPQNGRNTDGKQNSKFKIHSWPCFVPHNLHFYKMYNHAYLSCCCCCCFARRGTTILRSWRRGCPGRYSRRLAVAPTSYSTTSNARTWTPIATWRRRPSMSLSPI